MVLFHRSGDKDVGTHGNSELWLPEPNSHRIALIFYQTQLKGLVAAQGEADKPGTGRSKGAGDL